MAAVAALAEVRRERGLALVACRAEDWVPGRTRPAGAEHLVVPLALGSTPLKPHMNEADDLSGQSVSLVYCELVHNRQRLVRDQLDQRDLCRF